MATNSFLTAFKNKIPSVSNLVKKTDHNTKLMKLKMKLLIIMMINIFNKVTENLAARLKQVDLASKSGIANFVHKTF